MDDIVSAINDKATAKKVLERLRSTKINVMLIGGTGVGKSSTIDALFKSNGCDANIKIGDKPSPETMEITKYELQNLVIWDSPGLGDSTEGDAAHKTKIVDMLRQVDADGQPVIDLVFLILDAGSRDLSSAYTLIKDVVLPNIHQGSTPFSWTVGLRLKTSDPGCPAVAASLGCGIAQCSRTRRCGLRRLSGSVDGSRVHA